MSAGSAGQRRRLAAWILWSAGGLGLLGTVALVLWLQLPRWAPEWVVRHSPFVDPVLRAIASERRGPGITLQPEDMEFFFRVQGWGPGAVPTLARALESSDPELRVAALFGLAAFAGRFTPTPELTARIIPLTGAGVDVRTRAWAFAALRSHRTPALAAIRRAAMGDPCTEIRSTALADLDPGTDERDLELLLTALGDPVAEVRSGAVIRVQQLTERRAIPALIRLLSTEGNYRVLSMAMQVLLAMRAAEALPALGELAMRQDGKSGGMALTTAFAIAPAESTGVLLAALASPQRAARLIATMKLGELREPRALAPLLAVVAERDPLLAGMAIIALGRIGDAAATGPVLERLTNLAEFAEARHREHERLRIPDSVHLSEDFDFAAMVAVVDLLPMSPEQRKRWDDIRQRR